MGTASQKSNRRKPTSNRDVGSDQRALFREIVEKLPDMDNAQLAELLTDLKPIRAEESTEAEKNAEADRAQQILRAPRNDDELWQMIKELTGYEIPRVAVCHDHCAPFDPIADAYFNRESAILIMASREGGKTIGVAVLHYVNAETKPGIEGITFGAIKKQAQQAYKYVRAFVFTRDETGTRIPKPQIDGDPTQSQINWKTGSQIEIIVGTKSGVNSPHPQTVHADEVDLMEAEVFAESQPVDLVIPTPIGPRRFGDLQMGDSVFGSYGEPTSITKIRELGDREVFRVELTDGRSTECCAEHLWMAGYVSSYGRRAWQVRRLEDLDRVATPDPRGGNSYRWAIPQQPPVHYEERDAGFLIHPYVLGVLLGDGCIRRRLVQFRSNDEQIVETVKSLLPRGVGVYPTQQDPPVYRITRGPAGKSGAKSSPNPLVTELERLGLEGCGSHEKFIPRAYLEASPSERLMLLRGLMDTDGSCTKDPYFATVSERLARDVKELVLSLGGRALMRKKSTSQSSFENCGYIYEVSASLPLDVNPFWVRRKAEKLKPRKRTLMPSIRSVASIGIKSVRCIGVENGDGIYLTNDFIVTHNSRNMSSSKTLPGGKRIPAIDIVTSTRKSTRGPMQALLNEVDDAKKNGHRPPWTVYAFCFKEAAAEMPACRCVDPIDRVRRLLALGRSPNELCECDKIVKGEWDEHHPRTLESICRGDLFRSRGWMHYDDIVRKFMQNSQAVWEAQMECRRPMADGLYLPTFSRPRHCVRGWIPRPQYGRITMGVDWGGGEGASVVLWVQGPLLHPVEVVGFTMRPLMVPQGAYVAFDQFHWDERIGATRMADLVVAREIAYRQKFPGWRVRGRFADMAGAQQRNDWHEHSPPLRTQWYITRDFDPSVETVQGLMTDNKLYVDVDTCNELADDFEGWRMKGGKEVHDESSHGPAALRYDLGNVVVVERRREREHGAREAMPAVRERGVDSVDRAGLLGAVGSGDQGVETEQWRQSMGMMTSNVGSDSWRP